MKTHNKKKGQPIQWISAVLIWVVMLGFGATLETHAEDVGKLEKLWEVSGLKQPESAIYDAQRNVLYVSNINGHGDEKNGAGFLSKVSLDGTIENLEWITGLNAPKGMAISKNTLYVTDIDQLVEIDIEHRKIVNTYPASEAKLLNDVAITPLGDVYVSDTWGNAIFYLHNSQLDVWVKSAELEYPNGILVDGERLIVAGLGKVIDPTVMGAVEFPGHLKQIPFADRQLSSLGDGTPVGILDGVEADGNGHYYASDFVTGKIFLIEPSGKATMLVELKLGSADIEYIQDKKLLLIPMVTDGQLMAFQVQ